MRGARTAFVVVAVAGHADAVAQREGVVQQPFEGAPGGMHLHRAFQPAVMGRLQVGIAAAGMGDHHRVLALQRLEQRGGGVYVAGLRGAGLHQHGGGAADRAAFGGVEHVAVAAPAGVAGPFVARHRDEAARHVVVAGEAVEPAPERVGHLEVVALVADDVHEGAVSGVGEIILNRIGADGLLALPVQVTPEMAQLRRGHHAQRIGPAQHRTGRVLHRQRQLARGRAQPLQHQRAVVAAQHRLLGQAGHRGGGPKPQHRFRLLRRVAPAVLGQDGEAERVAGQGRPDRLPARRRAGHQGEFRRRGDLGEFVGGEGIHQHLELEGGFAIGLQPQPGRPLAAVAKARRDGLAGAQEALADADEQRVHPRPDVHPVHPCLQHRAVAGLDAGVVGGLRVGELRPGHVRAAAPGDLEVPAVVDAEGAGGVGQHQLGEAAGFERAGRG